MHLKDGRHIVPKNVENLWQYSKVYSWMWDHEHNEPNDQYWEWAEKGWSNPRAERYPVGKNIKPVCSWLWGEPHDYVSARVHIYIQAYLASLISDNVIWELMEWYEQEPNPVIVDFDVYDKTHISYTDVFLDPRKKAGHGFVIGAFLEYGSTSVYSWLADLKERVNNGIGGTTQTT